MILIIAEKPSVGRDIAAVVGADRSQRGHREGGGYLVSWCVGHLLEACQPEDYDPVLKRWSRDTLPIFPNPFRYTVQPDAKGQYDHLVSLMARRDVDSLICATDAGREGEHIFRLVYQAAGCEKPWKRLWTSSMEPEAIRAALDSMPDGHDYDHLAQAARCRQEADWLYGINLTRLYTSLYGVKLPTGRVQSPTLAMIVHRQEQIDNFQPQPYYIVSLTLGGRFTVRHRFETQEEAQSFLSTGPNTAVIRSVTHEKVRTEPPRLYSSSAIQQEANRLFGYTGVKTLADLQGLYEQHLCTYPRSESECITKDMVLPTVKLIALMQKRGLLPSDDAFVDVHRLVNGMVGEHPAILPTASLTAEGYNSLNTAQRNLMTLLLFRLLEATDGACVQDAVKVEAEVNGVLFTAKEKVTVERGWTRWRDMRLAAVGIAPKETTPSIPTRTAEGEQLAIAEATQTREMTQPPKPYTEAELLAKMETAGRSVDDPALREAMRGKGLGTAATRAAIIESLVRNGYVVRKGKYLIPTEKAKQYISVLLEPLKDPVLTAQWEARLLDIQEGRGSPEQFMEEIKTFLSGFITGIQRSYSPELYEGIFPDTDRSGRKSIGKCPLCGGDVAEYPKSYSCTNYKARGCRFTIWKTVAGRTLPVSVAQSLLSHGRTGTIQGFRDRKGGCFDAALELVLTDNGAEIRFVRERT